VDYHFRYEDMTEAERARRFRYFTVEQADAAMHAWGLDAAGCTDPDALRAGAAIQAAAEERIAEREADAEPPSAA
jgi:hypothetical protein